MKKAILIALAATAITGCSSMKDIPDRKTYAQPSWYQECEQHATEGYFWWSKEFVYACGAGESKYQQAAEAQSESFALNSFASRINTKVDSKTTTDIQDNKRTTRTTVTSSVDNTRIYDQVEAKKIAYTKDGTFYSFIRLKMTKSTYERLKAEARGQ
jgi:hypothetical protein